MVKCCIAAGCSNTYGHNVNLFNFPRDPTLRDRWTKQVRRTRTEWSGLTVNFNLRSNHFTEDCFVTDSLLAPKLGIKMQEKLKPDAVPTIFPRPVQLSTTLSPSTGKQNASARVQASSAEQTADHTQQATKKRQPAYEKRATFHKSEKNIIVFGIILLFL